MAGLSFSHEKEKREEMGRLVQTENAFQVSSFVGQEEEGRGNLLHPQLCMLTLPSPAQAHRETPLSLHWSSACCFKIRKQILQSLGAFAADMSRRN